MRKKWFESMVGKKIYRNAICGCDHCQNGVFVQDEKYASYLYEMELNHQHDELKLMYFETKKQALNFDSWVEK